MTVADVEARIEAIRAKAWDPEVAHSMEDGLWREVLEAIADGTAEDPPACAATALKTQVYDFQRWCS